MTPIAKEITDSRLLHYLNEGPTKMLASDVADIVRKYNGWNRGTWGDDQYDQANGNFFLLHVTPFLRPFASDSYHSYVVFDQEPQSVGVFTVEQKDGVWIGRYHHEDFSTPWLYDDMPAHLLRVLRENAATRAGERWRAACYRHAGMDIPLRVGLGVTETSGSDRHPFAITSISPNGKTIGVKRIQTTLQEGSRQNEIQRYQYGEVYGNELQLRQSRRRGSRGRWYQIGAPEYPNFTVGYADQYYDPSF